MSIRPTAVVIGPSGQILHEGAGTARAATGRSLPVLVEGTEAPLSRNPEPEPASRVAKVALEAFRRIAPLFHKMRWYSKAVKEKRAREHLGKDAPGYSTPRKLARSWLGGNYKLDKRPDTGKKAKILVQGVSLLPHALVKAALTEALFAEWRDDVRKLGLGEKFNLCIGSSQQCRDACLAYSGHNYAIQKNAKVKMAKTVALLSEPVAFCRFLLEALEAFARQKADEHYVRLNVLSDIPWEAFCPWIFTLPLGIRFYDYTKVGGRKPPKGYDLTFSFSGENEPLTKRELAAGRRAAVVFLGMRREGEGWLPFKTTKEEAEELTPGELFENPGKRKKYSQAGKHLKIPCDAERCVLALGHAGEHVRKTPLPKTFWGYPVVDGDLSDLRPLARSPCIVALRYKTPFGQEIDPEKEAFTFVTKAFVVDDEVVRLSRNPGEPSRKERVEYLVAAPTARAEGFGYDPEVGPDAEGTARIVAEVKRAGEARVTRAGQFGG